VLRRAAKAEISVAGRAEIWSVLAAMPILAGVEQALAT
jgi:hypothetical protein